MSVQWKTANIWVVQNPTERKSRNWLQGCQQFRFDWNRYFHHNCKIFMENNTFYRKTFNIWRVFSTNRKIASAESAHCQNSKNRKETHLPPPPGGSSEKIRNFSCSKNWEGKIKLNYQSITCPIKYINKKTELTITLIKESLPFTTRLKKETNIDRNRRGYLH